MCIKVQILLSYLDNSGNVNDKKGEQFPQDIKTMEERYQKR